MDDPTSAVTPTQAQIDRINEISQLARTAWFSLIAYLLFVGITLLGVEDVDFFVPIRQTQLPLVNIQIPTASFFYAAPILGVALYIYLHLFLIKLWEAHGQARTRDADPTHHWLVNDFALIRQGDPVARARPLSWMVGWITVLLVWLAGPIILGYAWWRSMPAHDEWMTLLNAACLFTTMAVGFTSWTTARARLHDNGAHRAGLWHKLAATACALALVAVSWLRTEGGLDRYLGAFPLTDLLLAPASLSGLGEEPPDWREHDYARGRYREDWCGRHGVPLAICEHIGTIGNSGEAGAARAAWCKQGGIGDGTCLIEFAELEASFDAEWGRERAAYLAQLNVPNQTGRDLRGAYMVGAFLAGGDFGWSRLQKANLYGARMEGASLVHARLDGAFLPLARLEGADLGGSWLEGANLSGARLEEANLFQARLEGANLGGARLLGADLFEARLEGANLRFARLDGANLSGARLDGADLRFADFRGSNWSGGHRASPAQFADFRGARGLTQTQLENFIGNTGTLLPTGNAPGTGAPFYVWSCWEQPPPGLEHIVKLAAGPDATDADRAALRAEFVCGRHSPRRTGTPLSLDAPYPQGHPLAERD
jgi:uncharacterized protein YjbI with pentapeptide repeats